MSSVTLSGGAYGGATAETDQLGYVARTDDHGIVWLYHESDNPGIAELCNIDTSRFVSDDDIKLAGDRKVAWENIKTEHDRRKDSGVKVGEHWFHTDSPSRIQQMWLKGMGDALPPGLMWKTLSPAGGLFDPVYVPMTPELATQICVSTMIHDSMYMIAKDTHRANMLMSADPLNYDYSQGWPESFLEACGLL